MRLKVWIQIKQQHITTFLQRYYIKVLKSLQASLQLLFNNAISNSELPDNLKVADVTPVFKKKDPLDKASYRFVSAILKGPLDCKSNNVISFWMQKMSV